jgi:hypothetical protein
VAKFTVASTPSIRLSFFWMRDAHEAHVIPPMSRRMRSCGTAIPSSGHLVARLVDGGAHRRLVERAAGCDHDLAGGEVDRHVGHIGDL